MSFWDDLTVALRDLLVFSASHHDDKVLALVEALAPDEGRAARNERYAKVHRCQECHKRRVLLYFSVAGNFG